MIMKRNNDTKIEVDEVCNIKKEIIINYNLCIVCQNVSKEKVVKAPQQLSLENSFLKLKDRAWENQMFASTVEQLENDGVTNLSERKCTYHRSCYGRVTNVNTQRRSLERNENKNNISIVTASNTTENSSQRTRSANNPYNILLCFFCQEKSDMPLFNLRSFNRHSLMKEAISESKKQILSIRFNSFSDAHAGDVKYHANCMITNVDKILASDTERKMNNYCNDANKYAVEEELVRSVANGIHTGSIYSMKDIHTSYMEGLKDKQCYRIANREND